MKRVMILLAGPTMSLLAPATDASLATGRKSVAMLNQCRPLGHWLRGPLGDGEIY